MPVVGGYLAYIGYFCVQAGVALCISKGLVSFSDWSYLLDKQNLILAIPGLAAGLILTLVSRKISNDAALPLIMVAIPASFYALLYVRGESLENAREEGWVGQVAPSVPVSDLIKLVDFSLIQWSCWTHVFSTWCGMVFVVSFASCLDVAAISIDMGEALDTNHELATVGICNRKFSPGLESSSCFQSQNLILNKSCFFSVLNSPYSHVGLVDGLYRQLHLFTNNIHI